LVEDEQEPGIKDQHKSHSASARSADTRLLSLASLPSVGSMADPPQFPPGHYDGPDSAGEEEGEADCIARNLKELGESWDWRGGFRAKDHQLSPEEVERLFPDEHRQGNEDIWSGMEPSYALSYAVCVLIVLDLCKKSLFAIEERKNNTRLERKLLEKHLPI